MTADRDQDRASDDDGRNDGEDRPDTRPRSAHGDDGHDHDDREPDEDKGKRDDDDDDDDGDEDQDDHDGRPPLYKRPLFWLIFGVVAIVLIVGGLLFWLHARKFESTDDAFVDAHVVRLAAQVSGQLTAVANVDNRHVEAGALLATIETDATQATVEQARAQWLQAEAQIEQARAQVTSAQAQRAQAVAEAVQPEAQAAKAQADLKRYVALRQIDAAAVAGTQIDQARAQADSSAGQAAAARRAIDNADAQIAVAEKQVKSAQAQKAGAQAQIDSAKVTYGHLDIRAPVAGQVVNRSVNVGSYVQAGSQLMAIVPDRMWVTANFKETQLALMRLGQPVDISVDAFPDVHFVGHVDSIQRGAGQAFALLPPQNATGNYVKVVQRVPVRILFDRRNRNDPDLHHYAIGPGMSVVPTVRVR
ncbi:HlyD family secretion protein [Sphingomonas abietis]|uniref:HlyD family secretion protein n=1 Tax=Sphingomonas abietis TaxID=3012344 RepID=A0ABY7NIM1_9SPHN|nr:HlyD family secretion protein [Sphingomonas abietis]WBO21371.1 HlyD family secretion protein [Sphingomonas abietis]